ncbi:hypothetical protein IVG45_04390 [Methylomonas sp. LL1]|uniref:hypothetical protein n=1 Tax=Methylomonas sp. LL1 TaxID=2785785 RepID=UPI0018C3A106|nr:hypothetical protein [Methylomonas sp. LL1]QPK64216.1 hypothetical protein IVG45_04390 [Methylomonas sp. LL1]
MKLDFWINSQIQPNRYRVMSDVRLPIEQLFAEADSVIPFLQRDVHHDVVKPLEVEMVKANSAGQNKVSNT